jgi:hypothetical protein
VVGCTTGSRGEVPGERKPVIRDGGGTAAATTTNASNKDILTAVGFGYTTSHALAVS